MGTELKPIRMTRQDLEHLEVRKRMQEELLQRFRVPARCPTDSNRTSYTQAVMIHNAHFWGNPWACWEGRRK